MWAQFWIQLLIFISSSFHKVFSWFMTWVWIWGREGSGGVNGNGSVGDGGDSGNGLFLVNRKPIVVSNRIVHHSVEGGFCLRSMTLSTAWNNCFSSFSLDTFFFRYFPVLVGCFFQKIHPVIKVFWVSSWTFCEITQFWGTPSWSAEIKREQRIFLVNRGETHLEWFSKFRSTQTFPLVLFPVCGSTFAHCREGRG